MTLNLPEGFDVERLREQIRATYDRVASDPEGEFHFHRGGNYAARYLNYLPGELARVPSTSTQRFAGVGNPHRAGPLRSGETVLDHACGAGMDLVLAAHRVGALGRVIGVDMTPSMLECAWRSAVSAKVDGWTSLFHGFYEDLPVDDASIDVVISNGALNLAPDKRQVFAEIFRVLRPGGRLHLSDVVVQREPVRESRVDFGLWAACVAGAITEHEMLANAAGAGLIGARITERFDCFCGASAEFKVPRDVQIGAVNLFARKPRIG